MDCLSSKNICFYLADPAHINNNDFETYNSAVDNFDKALNCSESLFVYVSSSKVYLDKKEGLIQRG